MANVEARLKVKGKEYQILVDVEKALELKKGEGTINNVLISNDIFYDLKKGLKASDSDLNDAFGTNELNEVAEKIVKQGEVVLPAEYRKKELEGKERQVITFLSKNALDPTTGQAITETRIESAIEQAKIKIDNKPIEQQINGIVSKLKEIMPIKIETKKLKITIPSLHTGKVYGLINEYKEKEEWLSNGDLQVVINIPAGLEMDFYDKLNGVTHGSAIVEGIKEND